MCGWPQVKLQHHIVSVRHNPGSSWAASDLLGSPREYSWHIRQTTSYCKGGLSLCHKSPGTAEKYIHIRYICNIYTYVYTQKVSLPDYRLWLNIISSSAWLIPQKSSNKTQFETIPIIFQLFEGNSSWGLSHRNCACAGMWCCKALNHLSISFYIFLNLIWQ